MSSLKIRNIHSGYKCESPVEHLEAQSTIDAKFLEHQNRLKSQDVINQKKLNTIQRNYIKCTKGKCPALINEHAIHPNGIFFKRRKTNYLSKKKHDAKLSRVFIDRGRKKRIEILQAEVNDLDLKLNVASGKSHIKEIDDNYKKIEDNLRQQEDMIERIKKAKIEIIHIKSQIERLDRKNIELDHDKEAEVPFFEHFKRANRQLEIHENRLQISRQQESKMATENKQLRELLCKMLYFRSIFNKHWNQIVDKLKNRKKFLLDMIERSSTAFSQDADQMNNYKKLQMRRNQDKETAIAEMLKMKRQIDANDIMDLFLGQKGKYRPFAPLQNREVARRTNFKIDYNNRLNFYQLVLNEIEKQLVRANGDDVKKTASFYLRMDNELYGYYRYRDSMNRRLDEITLLASTTRKEFNKDYMNIERIREFFRKKIKEREQTLQDEINKTMKCKMANDKQIREIEKYSNVLFKIIKTLRCDLRPVNKLLRKQTIMDENNIEIYLSVLEHRVNDIIAFLYCKQRGNVDIHIENPKYVVRSLKHSNRPVPKVNEIITTQQCPECAQTENVIVHEAADVISKLNDREIREIVINKTKMTGLAQSMHNLSACNLPRSGIIASRRYAE